MQEETEVIVNSTEASEIVSAAMKAAGWRHACSTSLGVSERMSFGREKPVEKMATVRYKFTDETSDPMTLTVGDGVDMGVPGVRVVLQSNDDEGGIAYVTKSQLQDMIDVMQPFASDNVVVEEPLTRLDFTDAVRDNTRVVCRPSANGIFVSIHNTDSNSITGMIVSQAHLREIVDMLQGHLEI